MTFDEILEQVIALLKRQGRVSYRALKRRFEIDDDYIEDLKEELIQALNVAIDEDGRVLVSTSENDDNQVSLQRPEQPEPQPIIETDQTTSVESPPTNVPDAERRQLTVMFVDLVGSTELSGQLDPEDYREVVRQYQQVCSEVIQRYDGHIAQYLGDGVLVYFGFPQAHEDDAQRAVRTGLGIIEAMKTLNQRLEQTYGIPLAVRIGIHTGLTVIGSIGAGARQEQLALGETPNVAARIQGLSQPDTVVISDATYRLIQGYFDCETIGELDLRGVLESVGIYRVVSESGAQSRLDIATIRGLTPLVGREQEVGLLLERWEQAKDGNGQVILLSGEAGIGKSRLIQALKDHVAEQSHTRLECRSLPYFTNSALYPIIDMVQRTLRFHADDTPEQKLEKLEHNLSQYRLPLEETVPLFSTLLSLPIPEDRYPTLNLTPQRQRQKTLEAIVAIILELAEQQPVLFILEDLHWTDPTSLELLDLLIDQTSMASLCALLTCRPEHQPTWSHRSYLTEMTLNRLSRQQVEQMVERIAGGKTLPAEVMQQLVDKTDGVPLYVEEMTKSLLESEVLQEKNGHYELVGPISSLTIPATLQDSLMARLDRLMTAKVVAQLGATIGRQFSYDLLREVSQLDEMTLNRELGRLVDAELVYQRGLPPQTTYTFKHALIQDAAYKSLLRSTRQGYHRRIAEVLEEQFPETAENQPELLAHHYEIAAELSTHFLRARDGLRAVQYLRQAGANAMRRHAHQEAIELLYTGVDALALLPHDTTRFQHEIALYLALGASLTATKGYAAPEVEQAYSRALELSHPVNDSSQRFRALLGLQAYYVTRGNLAAARAMSEQARHIAHLPGQPPSQLLRVCQTLGQVSFHMGEFVEAKAHLEQGLQLDAASERSSRPPLQDPSVVCLTYLAWTLAFLGYPTQAQQYSHEALGLAQKLRHPFNLIYALWGRACLYQFYRELSVTQECTEALLALATEYDLRFIVSLALVCTVGLLA